MGRELEQKYRTDRATLAAIRERFDGFTPIEMETVYYDTPGGDFGRRRWTLRRRYENGKAVCTLKTPHPDGGRGEWETECPDIQTAIPELCKLGAPRELLLLAEAGLQEVCGARFTRLATQIPTENGFAELALDEGVLIGGGKTLPLCEVEVELKSGSEAAAWMLAEQIAGEFHLVPEYASKHKRALALARE